MRPETVNAGAKSPARKSPLRRWTRILREFAVQIANQARGVFPLARGFGLPQRDPTYTTLLTATGLTFGTISALFGLENHLIDQTQYTILVTVVIASAVVPTIIAQTFFQPEMTPATRPDVEAVAPSAAQVEGWFECVVRQHLAGVPALGADLLVIGHSGYSAIWGRLSAQRPSRLSITPRAQCSWSADDHRNLIRRA